MEMTEKIGYFNHIFGFYRNSVFGEIHERIRDVIKQYLYRYRCIETLYNHVKR
jgi:hypothetical protein